MEDKEYKVEVVVDDSDNNGLIKNFLDINRYFMIDIEAASGSQRRYNSFYNHSLNNIMSETPYSFYFISNTMSKYVFIDPEKYSYKEYLKSIWNNKILQNYKSERVIYFGQEMEKNFFNYLTRFTSKENIKKSINFSKSFDLQDIFSRSISKNDNPVISFKFTLDGKEEILKTMKLSTVSVIIDCIKNNNSKMDLKTYEKITRRKWDRKVYMKIDSIFANKKYNEKGNQKFFKDYNKYHVEEMKEIYMWAKEVLLGYGTK